MYFLCRFYAGGSERSGQQIVGPPRKKSPNELVDDLFKGAKEHGAVAVERVTRSPGESSKTRVSVRVSACPGEPRTRGGGLYLHFCPWLAWPPRQQAAVDSVSPKWNWDWDTACPIQFGLLSVLFSLY